MGLLSLPLSIGSELGQGRGVVFTRPPETPTETTSPIGMLCVEGLCAPSQAPMGTPCGRGGGGDCLPPEGRQTFIEQLPSGLGHGPVSWQLNTILSAPETASINHQVSVLSNQALDMPPWTWVASVLKAGAEEKSKMLCCSQTWSVFRCQCWEKAQESLTPPFRMVSMGASGSCL